MLEAIYDFISELREVLEEIGAPPAVMKRGTNSSLDLYSES